MYASCRTSEADTRPARRWSSRSCTMRRSLSRCLSKSSASAARSPARKRATSAATSASVSAGIGVHLALNSKTETPCPRRQTLSSREKACSDVSVAENCRFIQQRLSRECAQDSNALATGGSHVLGNEGVGRGRRARGGRLHGGRLRAGPQGYGRQG